MANVIINPVSESVFSVKVDVVDPDLAALAGQAEQAAGQAISSASQAATYAGSASESASDAAESAEEAKAAVSIYNGFLTSTSYVPTSDQLSRSGYWDTKTLGTYTNMGGIQVLQEDLDSNKQIRIVYTESSNTWSKVLQGQDLGGYVTETDFNAVKLENPVKNILINPLTFTGWIGGGVVTDGVLYFSQQNQNKYLNPNFNYPAGTKVIMTVKMKSTSSVDYHLGTTLRYTDGTSSLVRVYPNSPNSIDLGNGWYQLIRYITLSKDLSSFGFDIQASLGSGTTYPSGQGVYATEPYIGIYEDGQEFYFAEQNYFPPDFIPRWSDFSLMSKNVEESIKLEIIDRTISRLGLYDPNIKINMLGDSFTALGYDDNRGFLFFSAKYLGLEKSNIANYGIGGTRISNNSFSTTDTNAMVNRYTTMLEADVLGIMGGFNDSNSPFPTWSEKLGSVSTKTDPNTIWGAYSIIIEGWKSMYPYGLNTVFLMTYPYDQDNTNKIQLMDTIRDIAIHYNLPLLDFHRLCGFKHGLNSSLSRIPLNNGLTWIDGQRISYNDGFTIWTGSQGSASSWSYIADYIPVNPSLYKTIAKPTNANVLQYRWNGSSYEYIGYSYSIAGREDILQENCTHIRVQSFTSSKGGFTIEDGEYVTDGVHPNLIGNRDKMAPVFAEFMNRILPRNQ